jgi:leucyl aminopeptidase
MSWTQFGYPATFATEGDPLHGGFPGDFDPYIHGVKDTMDIDDERGRFSLDVSLLHRMPKFRHHKSDTMQHMARFAELAIAFAVEQAGWDNKWR